MKLWESYLTPSNDPTSRLLNTDLGTRWNVCQLFGVFPAPSGYKPRSPRWPLRPTTISAVPLSHPAHTFCSSASNSLAGISKAHSLFSSSELPSLPHTSPILITLFQFSFDIYIFTGLIIYYHSPSCPKINIQQGKNFAFFHGYNLRT